MPVKVCLKNLRTAPRKVRLVVNLIRGMKVDEAMEQLKYLPQRATVPITKLLESAVAAAENNFKMYKADLFISKINVDDGAILKRSMPHAMGRAFPILKRTSTITIELDKKVAALEELEYKKSEGYEEALVGKGKEKSLSSETAADKSKKEKIKKSKN